MIRRKHPIIFFEHHFLSDEQIRNVTPAGYALQFILNDGRLSQDFADRVQSSDCILIPADRQKMFDAPVAGAAP
jgi:hypothetical protein